MNQEIADPFQAKRDRLRHLLTTFLGRDRWQPNVPQYMGEVDHLILKLEQFNRLYEPKELKKRLTES